MTFDEVKRAMTASGPLRVGGGASEADIQNAEAILGVQISGGYRDFLLAYGWGGVGYLELYGLGNDVPAFINLIDIAMSEWTEMMPKLRRDLLPIRNDGSGNLYCLDLKSDGPKVVFWSHEAGEEQIPDVVAADFSSWFASEIASLE
jgi:hypothetical protein